MRPPVLICLLLWMAGTAAAQADGPDILIRDGTIVATATDYEMDGTMWTAFTRLEDSSTYLHRSTDHGISWAWRGTVWPPNGYFAKLELVVGEGDSGFVHLFHLDPRNNGDLRDMRWPRDGSPENLPVLTGPDTIRDFAVCRDYTGDNYWLYAVVTAPDVNSQRALRFLRSSTYGREWYVTDSSTGGREEPHLAGGAGCYVYFTGHRGDTLDIWRNSLYLGRGHWSKVRYYLDEAVRDPVIGAAFTLPESTATAWCVWSQDYQNSGDWDVKYSYSTDGGDYWSLPAYLAGSTQADEGYPDLRNFTSLGNQYINASYISDDNVYRSVYRSYAHATTPDQWSDTLRINQGSAGTGSEIRPKLCYTPGGPFSGAGCVFVGAGLNGCWWNGPYPSAVAERMVPDAARQVMSIQPNIGCGPFLIRATAPASVRIHDRAGRLVRTLALDLDCTATWDGTDDRGRQLANGVYFCRMQATCRSASTAGDYRATEKLTLQR